jgi:hypothetical protein
MSILDPVKLHIERPRRVYRYLDAAATRRLRREYGFRSDRALARAANVACAHLASCLTGRYPAGPKVLAGLLRALPGTAIEELTVLVAVSETRERVLP